MTFSLGYDPKNTPSYASGLNWNTGGNTQPMSFSMPTSDQFQMLQDANVDFMGRPIAPQSFADMTGLQKLSLGMDTIRGLTNLWLGAQQNRLARDSFNLQKGVLDTNLANQIASYNTALEDRVAGRFSDRERAAKQPEINDYLDRNRAVNRMA